MKLTSKLLLGAVLLLLSFLSVADLIYRPGHPVTFDGHIHMTTMNQYAQAMYDGEFPVTWANNFANYGHPLPVIAHQVPAYLGGFLILAGVTTELAYTLLLTISLFITTLLFFIFFKKFADTPLALTATVLATVFPYRALNIYTRGGLPELMATIFLPVLLLGVWNIQQKEYKKAAILLYLGTFLTAITHPMMLLVFMLPVGAYLLFFLDKKTRLKQLLLAGIPAILGVFSASFYLVPLLVEMRYFYQSRIVPEIKPDVFLSFKQLFDPSWFYTYTHPGPRGNYIKLGLPEFIIFVSAFITIFLAKLKKFTFKINNKNQIVFWSVLSLIAVILLLPISKPLYSLPLMYQIQYPWRFLTVLQLTIPLLFIFIINANKKLQNKYLYLFIIAGILWIRLPQFYGKNYIVQPSTDYYFNQSNLHSVNLNTVWSDNSENYPVKTVQAEIINGDGEFEILEEKNASRLYKTKSDSELRLIDYTFYFPGWNVYVDGTPTVIEYQDSNHRGLITYKVPAGEHEIQVIYEYSKVRLLSLILSILTLLGTIPTVVILNKLLLKKK